MPAPVRSWAAVGVWLVFLEFLTSVPGRVLPSLQLGIRIDWVAHFCLYGVLGALIARVGALAGWFRGRLVVAVLVISAFGVLDELHQRFIPDRSAEVMDWVMDTAGSATGVVVLTLLARTRWGTRQLL